MAIFTVDGSAFTFQVQSDWGDYSHRWPNDGAGRNLQRLSEWCQSDPDYVIRKLSYGCKELKDVLDESETRKAVRRWIGEELRDKKLTRDEYKERLWDLKCWDMHNETVLFYEAPTWLDHYLVGDLIQKRPSHAYEILYHRLLPFFGKELESHLREIGEWR